MVPETCLVCADAAAKEVLWHDADLADVAHFLLAQGTVTEQLLDFFDGEFVRFLRCQLVILAFIRLDL